MAYLSFGFLALVWGASFILMKKANPYFSSVEVGVGRMLGGAAVLGLAWLYWGRNVSLRRSDWPTLFVVTALGSAWPYSIQPFLVRADGSAFVAMTVSFTPLLTVLVSLPLLGQRPTLRQLLGVLFALGCLFVLMQEGLKQDIPWQHLALGISVPFGYAFSNTLIRRNLSHASPLEMTALALLASGVAVYSLVKPLEAPFTRQGSWELPLMAVLLLGVVGTGVALFLFNQLIQQQGPLFAGMVTNLVPLGAVGWGWADGELITARQVVALLGILVAVTAVQFGAARRPAT